MLKRFTFFVCLSVLCGILSATFVAAEPPTVSCTYDGNPARSGGDCSSRVPAVHSELKDYPVTCAQTPRVIVGASYCQFDDPFALYLQTPKPLSSSASSAEYWGFLPAELTLDFSKMTLGGVGPDAATYQANSSDNLSRVYPYTGFADKPLILNDTLPRESFRTYWRMSSLTQQLNARSVFFKRFLDQSPIPIFDSALPYSTPSASIAAAGGLRAAITPNQLRADMDEFFAAGANAYLVWQYSGDQSSGEAFESDQYSIFSSDSNFSDYCQVFKDESANGAVGVNIWALRDFVNRPDMITKHLGILKGCGVSIIRTFAGTYIDDPAALSEVAGRMRTLLDIVKNSKTGIQLLISVGDYSNGGGGLPAGAPPTWYQSEYRNTYLPFANTLSNAVAGHSSLYGLELANEPHCGGQPDTTIDDYKKWGDSVGNLLRRATGNVGYGQMAVPGGVCDDPSGPKDGFTVTNKSASITMTSAHYYDSAMKVNALLAAQKSSAINKPFYIGEAGGNSASTTTLPTYKISDLISDLQAKAPCLASYPLPQHCAIKTVPILNPLTQAIASFIKIGQSPEDVYTSLTKSDPDLKARYDSFVPTDIDNIRGYIGLDYVDSGNKLRSGLLAENIPLVRATTDITLDPEYGVYSSLSPDWLNNSRKKSLNPDTVINPLLLSPNLPLNTYLSLESLANSPELIRASKDIWNQDLGQGARGCFQFVPPGPKLPAPSTIPQRLPKSPLSPQELPDTGKSTEVAQDLLVPVKVTTQFGACTLTDPVTGAEIPANKYSVALYPEGQDPSRDPSTILKAIPGRTAAVFNNPLLQNFSSSTSQSTLSFVGQMISQPLFDFYNKFFVKNSLPMLAGTDEYGISQAEGTTTDMGVFHAGGVAGPSLRTEGAISRVGGQAEVDLCALRNFWLRPAGLQTGKLDDCKQPDKYLTVSGNLNQNPSGGICTTQNSGIKSQELINLLTQAASWAHVPIDVLTVVLKKEAGCVDARGNVSTDANRVCNLTDDQVKQYSEPGAKFPTNCSVGGPFTSYINSGSWNTWKNAVNVATNDHRNPNFCNLKDSVYAAALDLAASGQSACPQPMTSPPNTAASAWTLQMKQTALTGWAYGCNAPTACGESTNPSDPPGYAKYYCDALTKVCK